MHNPALIPIASLSDAEKAIKAIGSDPQSIPIMAPKMVSLVIKLDHIILQDAIIVKQDMLSLGGEVAVPKETFELHRNTVSILVSGSLLHFRTLIQKLKRHYPRIQIIANELETLIEEIK
jgi:dihydropteroate synthase